MTVSTLLKERGLTTQDEADELLLRLVQDRRVLLDALKELREVTSAKYAQGHIDALAFVKAGNAIAQAERP